MASGESSSAATSASIMAGVRSPASRLRAVRRSSSAGAGAASSDSLLMSIRIPVSLAASRAFWPFLPMASESWLSGTTMSAVASASDSPGSPIVTDDTLAGDSARATNVAGSCDHSMMSIFSPRSSRLMTWMRVPRRPTHAPIGSTSRLVDATATLARSPGSRAAPLTSTMPSAISGISVSNSRTRKPGCVRERRLWGPLAVFVVHLHVGVQPPRLVERDLELGIGDRAHYLLAGEHAQAPGLPVDLHADVVGRAHRLLGRRQQGRLQRLEEDLFPDPLLTPDL